MLVIIEGVAMCFALLVTCAVGIANGPEGLVNFYERDVQDRVVKLGYRTKKQIQKSTWLSSLALFLPIIFIVPFMVYYVNGAEGFWSGFWQICVILWIVGLFDRLFIDWYWVGHTKAWYIPGTDDLMPYIARKRWTKKWIGTIVWYPLFAAIVSGVMTLIGH